MLHTIPPIGTTFAVPDVSGPESKASEISGESTGEISFRIKR